MDLILEMVRRTSVRLQEPTAEIRLGSCCDTSNLKVCFSLPDFRPIGMLEGGLDQAHRRGSILPFPVSHGKLLESFIDLGALSKALRKVATNPEIAPFISPWLQQ